MTNHDKPEDATAVKSYRDLRVWQEAVDLVVACYKLTHGLPKHETYGLASQIQHASASNSS